MHPPDAHNVSSKSALATDLETLETGLGALQAERRALSESVAALEAQVADLQARLAEAEAGKREAEQAMDEAAEKGREDVGSAVARAETAERKASGAATKLRALEEAYSVLVTQVSDIWNGLCIAAG